jgi:hypothetical protein
MMIKIINLFGDNVMNPTLRQSLHGRPRPQQLKKAWSSKRVCSPSYADIRSHDNGSNGSKWMDFEHMIKQEHTGRYEDR